ncbi:hypothetical protein BGZ58_001403, partial [Dissophora ornata]
QIINRVERIIIRFKQIINRVERIIIRFKQIIIRFKQIIDHFANRLSSEKTRESVLISTWNKIGLGQEQ